MNSAHFIIQRVNIDMDAPDLATARKMQDEVVHLFYDWILPRLEQLLEKLVPKEVIIRLDVLDIDLEQLEDTRFEQDFGEALISIFARKIRQIAAPTGHGGETEQVFSTLSEWENLLETFLFFLGTGRLPWWSERNPDSLNEETLAGLIAFLPPEAAERLWGLLSTDTAAFDRLYLQFNATFAARVVLTLLQQRLLLGPKEHQLISSYLRRLAPGQTVSASPGTGLQQEFLREVIGNWRALLSSGSGPERTRRMTAELKKIYRKLRNSAPVGRGIGTTVASQPLATAQPLANLHRADEDAKDNKGEDGIYVENAGLVLLHPFLEYFFKEFDLLQGNSFSGAAARNVAIHLLHYLAAGRECPPEYLLTLEKFLCDADLVAPVPRFLHLNRAMKEECDTLLQAAISHWKALKNTSPAGLREGFLQRPGKLMQSSSQNRLLIESRAHDVLLDYLPWGYGIIKLPWLKQPLLVDWIT